MKILGRDGLSGVVKYILDLVFVGGIIIFLGLPFILKWYLNNFLGIGQEYYTFLLVFLYITGFFCIVIVRELRQIFISINEDSPFVMSTVKSLNRMGLSAFVISAVYLIKIIVLNSFFTIIITAVFFIAGLFSVILAEVFRQAVIVKEENDLTI